MKGVKLYVTKDLAEKAVLRMLNELHRTNQLFFNALNASFSGRFFLKDVNPKNVSITSGYTVKGLDIDKSVSFRGGGDFTFENDKGELFQENSCYFIGSAQLSIEKEGTETMLVAIIIDNKIHVSNE